MSSSTFLRFDGSFGAPPLYNLCINAIVESAGGCDLSRKEFRLLPDHVLFDMYHKMHNDKRLCLLAAELGNLDVFARMLRVKSSRYTQLFRCFQALLDHGANIADDLVAEYTKRAKDKQPSDKLNMRLIDLGMRLGTFLYEGAWYKHAHNVFNAVESLLLFRSLDEKTFKRLLQCYQLRLAVEGSYYMLKEADETMTRVVHIVEVLEKMNVKVNLSLLYATFSSLYEMRSEYDKAYKWSKKAIELLNENIPPRVIVEVLRSTSRTCVYKRRFKQARILIQQAVSMAEELFKADEHLCYANTLMDYGFYLLNSDNDKQSVDAYSLCLEIRKGVFNSNNMHVALGYEELAYALYVKEYSSGKFFQAWQCAEKAYEIMDKILPSNHMALASTKRVMALILEEIALDLREPWNKAQQQKYMKRSEELHKSALKLSLSAFGEGNVQTAKHYGNLGRLYQSMGLFTEAEHMHLQSIAIKEELLGKDDHEVGLSLGHLASLYNFHMKRYRDAEKLYLRSLEINTKIYGENYSGLQYDYRGLIKVYTEVNNTYELVHFTNMLQDWHMRREAIENVTVTLTEASIPTIVDKFLSLC